MSAGRALSSSSDHTDVWTQKKELKYEKKLMSFWRTDRDGGRGLPEEGNYSMK